MNPRINNPCPEKWTDMTPDGNGRFCAKCSKIVIDFTKKTSQEIIDFLNSRIGEDICGKLPKPLPVTAAVAVPRSGRRRYEFFSLAVYMAFGSFLFTACGSPPEEEPIGKVGIDSTTQAQMQHYNDSIAAADSAKQTTKLDTASISDSADIMSAVRVLDSIAALKKK